MCHLQSLFFAFGGCEIESQKKHTHTQKKLTLILQCNIFEVLSLNHNGLSFVTQNRFVLVTLIIMSGGFHPSLALLSSGIFGLDILNSGITKYELNEYVGIRVLFTTLAEV